MNRVTSADLRLARSQFVHPFYLGLETVPNDSVKLAAFHEACASLDTTTAAALLSEKEWRGRMTVSWMIGVNGWKQFVAQMVEQLTASEMAYAGRGYCVGLSLIASEQAQVGLAAYLDEWLPEHNCLYDQHWAMGALIHLDRARGTNEAERFLVDRGPWMSWLAAQTGARIESPVNVERIVFLVRGDGAA